MVKLYEGKKIWEARVLGKKETNQTKFIEDRILKIVDMLVMNFFLCIK